jgi:hypothetical protein
VATSARRDCPSGKHFPGTWSEVVGPEMDLTQAILLTCCNQHSASPPNRASRFLGARYEEEDRRSIAQCRSLDRHRGAGQVAVAPCAVAEIPARLNPKRRRLPGHFRPPSGAAARRSEPWGGMVHSSRTCRAARSATTVLPVCQLPRPGSEAARPAWRASSGAVPSDPALEAVPVGRPRRRPAPDS